MKNTQEALLLSVQEVKQVHCCGAGVELGGGELEEEVVLIGEDNVFFSCGRFSLPAEAEVF